MFTVKNKTGDKKETAGATESEGIITIQDVLHFPFFSSVYVFKSMLTLHFWRGYWLLTKCFIFSELPELLVLLG